MTKHTNASIQKVDKAPVKTFYKNDAAEMLGLAPSYLNVLLKTHPIFDGQCWKVRLGKTEFTQLEVSRESVNAYKADQKAGGTRTKRTGGNQSWAFVGFTEEAANAMFAWAKSSNLDGVTEDARLEARYAYRNKDKTVATGDVNGAVGTDNQPEQADFIDSNDNEIISDNYANEGE